MPASTPNAFDAVGSQFVDYYDTVRGYVRQEVTRLNLMPFLGVRPMQVVDIGGGDGRDAEWLAEQGHQVVLVEPSHEMRAKARQRIEARPEFFSGSVTIVEGDDYTLLSRRPLPEFDLVLSHGVLMYDLENPQRHVDRLTRHIKPGGLISLLTKGYNGAVVRVVDKGDLEALGRLKKTRQVVNNLGETAWAFEEREIHDMLHRAGAEVLKWGGIRIATEHLYAPVSGFSPSDLGMIIDVERSYGEQESTRSMGQMLHFIARRKD